MPMKSLDLQLPPEIALDNDEFERYVRSRFAVKPSDVLEIRKIRQSIDARSRQVKVSVKAELYVNEAPPSLLTTQQQYTDVSGKKKVVIVGAGPAGLFAALRLIELGLKPVIIERGKDVRSRRRDLAAINKEHTVNPDSNYCFGEGGAGTYSDGKLYTRSNKRGDIKRILEIFVRHGATEQILVDAHPHIGTNKLPVIIQAMRETILRAGGEVHFDTRVTEFILEQGKTRGVVTATGDEFTGEAVILATGHSARDIFEKLNKQQILIESKPFAMGIRIEHPQTLIDRIQYHCANDRGPYLPAAAYSLVTQTKVGNIQRGVFSFCMCPGGFIVPAATAPGEVVVNGMSPSRRDSEFANSGLVVAVTEQDVKSFEKEHGALAGLEFQRQVEQKACAVAGARQTAPAQLALDFVQGKTSESLRKTSYQPGLTPVPLREFLPNWMADSLKDGLKDFGQKMKGYLSNEAILVGVESRTSSPVRIPRNEESCEHPQIKGLIPCGEGAGYAGGIMSAAMDGERCANAVALLVLKR
jgi:uncharacterized FAD-dependent dehydrogenase